MSAAQTFVLIFVSLCITAGGFWFSHDFTGPGKVALLSAGPSLGIILLLLAPSQKPVLRFGGLSWSKRELCQHILITGATGSGKTISAINSILLQISNNIPDWGGMVLGAKGDEHEFVVEMLKHQNRSGDCLIVQVRPDSVGSDWKPPNRMNPLTDRSLPWSAHAKALVDTASALTEGQQSAFFKPAAKDAIANLFELIDRNGETPTHSRTLELISNPKRLHHYVDQIITNHDLSNPEISRLVGYFTSVFLESKAPEQREGIEGTVKTYLEPFNHAAIAEVFSSTEPNTFEIADVDQGAVIALTLPQRFVVERRFLNTYLKTLFYYHVRRRYDLPKEELKKRNQLLLVGDEYHELATASKDGMADHSNIDRLRDAGLAIIGGMQSIVSPDPYIGRENRESLILNFRTRIYFQAAEEKDAVAAAETVGKKEVTKTSKTSKPFGSPNYTKRKEDDFILKPRIFRKLRPHEAVVVHPRGNRFRRMKIPPRLPDGTIPDWY